ncbi:hypothetical protein [Streptomyces sp. NPDC048272]|uniref:hypothetical protein n=1 Tax=Streptomyces sp. NPDC048272 TaxID=3154616 RepID=UPI003443E971
MTTPEPDKGGRPAIGPKVPINFPTHLLRLIDLMATEAGTTRAEWVRRTLKGAANLEAYERHIAPGEWGSFLAIFGLRSQDPEAKAVARKLHAAATEGAITQGDIIVQARERRHESGYHRAALVTRELLLHGEPLTVYQVVKVRVSYPDIDWEGNATVGGWLLDNLPSAIEFLEVAAEGIPQGPATGIFA